MATSMSQSEANGIKQNRGASMELVPWPWQQPACEGACARAHVCVSGRGRVAFVDSCQKYGK